MSTKHFLGDPSRLVHSTLQAIVLTNPSVTYDPANKIVYLSPSARVHHGRPQISLISGGGSGHEPSFGAFVGQGLLSAAVIGTIFASPSAEQVRTAITSRVDTVHGILVIVMNYTGDILNFGVAVEKARAAGRKVEIVVVGDDVGVGRTKAGKVGRRGIAGTVLVHKIAGALAARGADLATVARVARLAAANLVSVGASLQHVHVPGRKMAISEYGDLAAGEVEIGMDIHNESGSGRAKVGLKELLRVARWPFWSTTWAELLLEMGAIVTEVASQLVETYGIRPRRILSGTYMTSLNGLGFSITLLNDFDVDFGGVSMIQLLDDPCEATGWASNITAETWESKGSSEQAEVDVCAGAVSSSGLHFDAHTAMATLNAGLRTIVVVEPEVTRYDTIVGDGDCGIGLKRGAAAIIEHLTSNPFTGDVVVDISEIVTIVETTMDGTSGAVYAIFLNALVASLRNLAPGAMTPKLWAIALEKSCEVLSRYMPARPEGRTLIDALYPFVDILSDTGDANKAANAAMTAAEGTKGMKAALGRTVYIGGSNFEEVPDPGAWALASFSKGMFEETYGA
ncbi:hypothetical protein FOXYS1_6848 [Fusarium oxysporum]|uniref:Dihydroxyacetone kinase n=1 Tax=Fusarium oxysporum TaxID=5507 RepID=A0A8H5AFM5_FUSOX|nr:hypothetical protein FOXYS1_6848 [Fusarium oxysporum]